MGEFCANCGKVVADITLTGETLFCSPKCKELYDKHQSSEHPLCMQCGQEAPDGYLNGEPIFCSLDCKMEYRMSRESPLDARDRSFLSQMLGPNA